MMHHRITMLVAGTLGALALAIGLAAPARGDQGPAAPTRPHIVLYLSDAHGYADSPLYDPASPTQTPHLVRIASAGTTYTHAFTTSPTPADSQIALHTGSSAGYRGADSDRWTLAMHLRSVGYRPVIIGPRESATGPLDGCEWLAPSVDGSAPSGDGPAEARVPAGERFDLGRWLDQATEEDHRPLFLVIHDLSLDPFSTQTASSQKLNDTDTTASVTHPADVEQARAQYARRVAEMDRRLGQTYDVLGQVLPPEETLFLYTTYHGAPLPYGKWNLYDAGVRTPLVTVWRNRIPAGSRMDALVSSVDLLPTLLEIAGGLPPSDIEGRSFASLLRGESFEHRDVVFTSVGSDGSDGVYPACAVRDRRFKYIRNLAPESDFSTPERRYARVLDSHSPYRWRPVEELYDLLSDPGERRNLARDPAYADNLVDLRGQISLWFRRHSMQRRGPRLEE